MARSSKKQDNSMNTIDLGKEMGLTLFSDTNSANIDNILPTGIPQFDRVFGGGIPFGRVTEIFGAQGASKSTFLLHLTRIATEMDVLVIWIDSEGTADNTRMEELGVDVSKVFSIQPGVNRLKNKPILTVESVGEELEHYISLFKENKPDTPILFIWDSLANTVAKAELEGDYDNKQMGVKSSSVTKMINKITPYVTNTNTGLIIINQVRDDLQSGGYGDGVKSTGGRAFEHSASLRVLLKQASQIKQPKDSGKEEYSGHIVRARVKKSKLTRPHQDAESFILSGWELPDGQELEGFDLAYNTFQEGLRTGLITKGQWKNYVTLNGEEIKLREKEWVPRLKEDIELYRELFKRTYVENFPEGFVAFDNKIVDVTKMEEYQELKEYYDELEKEKPKEETKEETKEEQEDQ